MMNDLTVNLLSALAVSVIISAMARVRSQKVKAILYTLPFPITIALIGSHSIATSLSIVGLMLTAGFLWGCYVFHTKLRANILAVDVVLAVLYVTAAYALVQLLNVSFWPMVGLYCVGWAVLMWRFSKRTFSFVDKGKSPTNPYIKALIVFSIAFGLFSAHQYLAAFVVTFPYNGVFAVFENRYGLLPQAALFTRNSLALLAYFVANYSVGAHSSPAIRYACSWLAFGVVLVAVNKYVPVKVRATT